MEMSVFVEGAACPRCDRWVLLTTDDGADDEEKTYGTIVATVDDNDSKVFRDD